MAKRFLYFYDEVSYKKELVEFEWFSGFSISQKQKSVESLHKNAVKNRGNLNILEVSSASLKECGQKASAFNLSLTLKNGNRYSVESLFQSSKVFDKSGLNFKVLDMNSKEAKRYTSSLHLKEKMIAFNFFGKNFPLYPETYFYNWLYANALFFNKKLLKDILNYDAFTDINFNPAKSINCQAEACSIVCFLNKYGILNENIKYPKVFLELVYSNVKDRVLDKDMNTPLQLKLFDI